MSLLSRSLEVVFMSCNLQPRFRRRPLHPRRRYSLQLLPARQFQKRRLEKISIFSLPLKNSNRQCSTLRQTGKFHNFFSISKLKNSPSPNSSYFHRQSAFNPFAQYQMASNTGQPLVQSNSQIPLQQPGFIQPQQTAFQQSPPNPFGPQQPSGHQPFSTFLPQATGVAQNQLPSQQPSFLRPQQTGANPFRQSMLVPQSTGMALFGGAGMGGQGNLSTFPPHNNSTGLNGSTPFTSTGIAFSATSSVASPFAGPFPRSTAPSDLPTRPSSTPLTSFGSTSSAASPPSAQPVKIHQTGTKNPFGPVTTSPPPIPRQPTLLELGMGISGNSAVQTGQHQNQPSQQPSQQQQSFGGFGFNTGALSAGATDISSVASSFALSRTNGNEVGPQQASPTVVSPPGTLNAQNTATTTAGSTFSDSLYSFSNQPAGGTNTSMTSNTSSLKPQITGFAGLKPFKPSSSFGASLLESLPPIPGSLPGTPALNGNGTTSPLSGGHPSSETGTQMSAIRSNSQPLGSGGFGGSGSTLGHGLRPQMTGGATNPFRASMIGSPTGGTPNFGGNSSFTPFTPNSANATTPFASNIGGGAFGSGFTSVQNQ